MVVQCSFQQVGLQSSKRVDHFVSVIMELLFALDSQMAGMKWLILAFMIAVLLGIGVKIAAE
jgi:hypothetical protein